MIPIMTTDEQAKKCRAQREFLVPTQQAFMTRDDPFGCFGATGSWVGFRGLVPALFAGDKPRALREYGEFTCAIRSEGFASNCRPNLCPEKEKRKENVMASSFGWPGMPHPALTVREQGVIYRVPACLYRYFRQMARGEDVSPSGDVLAFLPQRPPNTKPLPVTAAAMARFTSNCKELAERVRYHRAWRVQICPDCTPDTVQECNRISMHGFRRVEI
jgi:hypothetical protein